ncbi:MAG: MmgE/PrpD family protein [Pseudomonadota bacterium]
MSFETLSDFTLGNDAFPESALKMAAILLVDTLGVAAGATHLDAGKIARNHAVRFHAAGKAEDAAPILFDGRKASIPGASYAAATQIDNLDAHDGYNPTKGHIGCAVVPALIAFGHHCPGLSARDALKALVVSYEVGARAGIALHATVDDYHTSGAWNALGVAALGCRLRKSSPGHFYQALGIAEYHGPRSQMMREIANPTMLHDGSGMGAFTGTMAVLLAEEGFEGAPAITVTEDAVAGIWSDLGTNWTIEKNYIKPYPICRWAHAAIDALDALVKSHGFAASDVAAIKVRTFDEAAALFPGMPSSTSQAQYSAQFALAAYMVHGRIGPEHIQGEGLRDQAVADVLQRIDIDVDDRHSRRFPENRWSDVTVELNNGSILKSGDIHARGGPEAPMTEAEIREKFQTMTPVLDADRQTALWSMTDRLLDPEGPFSDLIDLVIAPVEAGDG